MDREKAIQVLKRCEAESYCSHYKRHYCCIGCGQREALDLAIEALGQTESEDCISRADTIKALCQECEMKCVCNHDCTEVAVVKGMPPVTPTERIGEWQITDAYPHNVYCSECHKKFAQTHWAVWEDGSLPRNYCPNCGAKMGGDME